MRKIFITTLILLNILSSISMPILAKSGDIAGNYYSTDIKKYLNGSEIEAINIGGQTLISAENMHYYGFNVFWNAEERVLKIMETKKAENGAPPLVAVSQISAGVPLGFYYETDIITYLDNDPVTAYNIGGKTYIHAEEMRNFGYVVNWFEDERKLEIISPMRAGFVYDIGLIYGKEQSVEGVGVFSVKYTKDGIIGTDDADYLNLTMYSTGKEYIFEAQFYQNEGLFYSSLLQEKLRSLCYNGYAVEKPCDKSEKYDLVNQTVSISINGQKANKVSVIGGAGNGHRDFSFIAEDLPKLKKDEINEIFFSVGDSSGESYKINIPEYIINSPDKFIEKLKKYPNDYMITYYQTDDYYVFFMRESESLGIVKDRMYIVNRNTETVSEDVLEQVRQIDGFNYNIINPFAFKVGEIKNNFFFSCSTHENTMDFYVELDTGKIHQN